MSETSGKPPSDDRQPTDRWFNTPNEPTPDAIVQALLLTGDALTADWPRLQSHLDSIAPSRAIFHITSIPPGFAPEEVRQQWVGVALPIRGVFDPHEGVVVLAREALEFLKEKSPEAHVWWQQYYADQAQAKIPNVDAEGFPEFLANVSNLIFNTQCGIFSMDI